LKANFKNVSTKNKIVSRQKLIQTVKSLKNKKQTIAFTNGCFDILHEGHVDYLEKAKGRNRVLIVGLNSDKSIKQIKDPRRPILSQEKRARILAALSFVDYVTLFDEPTPQQLIETLKPDILIKGADWKGKVVAGADSVRKHGGRVEFLKYVKGASTTNIIEKVLEKYGK
jgi:rfaE bifunctional protein nucleotidyltransferase chain/domain